MQARLKGLLQHWQLLKFNFLSEWCPLKQKPPKSVELVHKEWQAVSRAGHFGNWQCRALWGKEVSFGWWEPLKLCSIWQDMLEHPGLTAALLKISALKTKPKNQEVMQISLSLTGGLNDSFEDDNYFKLFTPQWSLWEAEKGALWVNFMTDG